MLLEGKNELSLDDLDKVNGGVIVNPGILHAYWVIDEKTGEVLDNRTVRKAAAYEICKHANVSQEVMDAGAFRRKYGFDMPSFKQTGEVDYWKTHTK